MVVETLEWLREMFGIEVVTIPVHFPVQNKAPIVDAVSSAFEVHKDIKLAVFSHISSMVSLECFLCDDSASSICTYLYRALLQPSLIEPIEDFIPIIRQKSPSTRILIDGAHAPGHIDLNIDVLDVDFYFGNCHKWMYAPKGSAFMWVAPSQRNPTFPEPTVISSTGNRDFLGRFAYTGTRDYTSLAALPAAFRFRSEILGGDKAIFRYCHSLAKEAADFLTGLWNTALLVSHYRTFEAFR
jgi:hypothetical protein